MPSWEEYWKECEISYWPLKRVLQGAVVVDVGADYGSSVRWFLQYGASEVIAFEKDPELFSSLLQNYGTDARVKVNEAWSGETVVGAQILKMDCEGCEQLLSLSFLRTFPYFALALHPPWISSSKYDELRSYALSVGATLTSTTPDGKEEIYVTQ